MQRCPRCLFQRNECLCTEARPIETRARIVIVRHAAELLKTTNSARWAGLCLQNFELHDYALEGAPLNEALLAGGDAWLLFPGSEVTAPPERPPARLLVPDGTWQQARRMVARLPSLRALPRLTLAPPSGTRRLRRPHIAEGMSTLEAIAEALELFGEPEPARKLRQLHEAAIARIARLRGRAV